MIRLAIIEDNRHYQQTLGAIMQLQQDIDVSYVLDDCESMTALFEIDQPDVVLMDIDLPGKSGIQGVWEIKERWPLIKVLMLTVFEDEDKIFDAIKAGANGYLLKKDTPAKIVEAITNVHGGESPMNGVVAAKVLEYFHERSKTRKEMENSNISPRENEILALLIKGCSYKEIAGSLYISVETLNSHIKNIYRKLNVHSRSELAAKFGHMP